MGHGEVQQQLAWPGGATSLPRSNQVPGGHSPSLQGKLTGPVPLKAGAGSLGAPTCEKQRAPHIEWLPSDGTPRAWQ